MRASSQALSTFGYILERNILRSCINKRGSSSYPNKPDPKTITTDYVGPFDPESNIRQYVRHIPKNDTALARRLREKQIATETWNHQFWKKHNKSFYDAKEKFIKENKLSGTEDNYQDKLSEFYKKFLNDNLKEHWTYNWAWYKKNFVILFLMLSVEIEKILNYMKRYFKK